VSSARRPVVWATIAALLLTTSGSPLVAAPASNGTAAKAASEITDFSARRYHRHYRHGNNAAGLAFMGLAFGAIAGAIAAERRRDYYESHRYYYGPGYYGEPYYGHPYYHGPY